MTNREFYTAVIALDAATDEMKTYAQERLAKLDATNEARKNKPSKTAIENAPLLEQIVNEVLTTELMTAGQVAETMGISTQKASALLRQLVAADRVEVEDVKLPKKGVQKGYRIPTVVDAAE